MLPDFKVHVTAPDPLEGAELAKFEASVMAAGREAKERKAKAIAVGLGHVGWRITEENVVWFWAGAHRREGLRAMEHWAQVRVCVQCVATLPREAFTDAPAPASTGGRKMPALRLLKVEP